MRLRLLSVLVLLGSGAIPAAAQPIAAPIQPTEGLFGQNRSGDTTGNGLTLTVTLGGGYDENVDPPEGVLPEGTEDPFSGYLGTVDTSLRYRRGTLTEYVELTGLGYVQTASISPSELIGGDADFRASTQISGRNGLTATAGYSYQPTLLFNAFGPITGQIGGGGSPGGGAPGVGAPQGITEQRWRAARGSAGFFRNFTPRQRMDVGIDIGQRTQVSGGPRFANLTTSANVLHAWNFREYVGVDFSYGFTENRQDDVADITQVVRSHTPTVQLRLVRPLAPQRQLLVTFTGGLTRATSSFGGVDATFTQPVAATSIRWGLTRTWSISADARRDTTILEGLSPEPFVTDMVSIQTQATPARRLQVALSGSYSRGEARFSGTGAFRNTVGIAQMQYALARCCAVYGSYSIYEYRLDDVALVVPGLADRYALNSVRTGLTIWFPLHGRF